MNFSVVDIWRHDPPIPGMHRQQRISSDMGGTSSLRMPVTRAPGPAGSTKRSSAASTAAGVVGKSASTSEAPSELSSAASIPAAAVQPPTASNTASRSMTFLQTQVRVLQDEVNALKQQPSRPEATTLPCVYGTATETLYDQDPTSAACGSVVAQAGDVVLLEHPTLRRDDEVLMRIRRVDAQTAEVTSTWVTVVELENEGESVKRRLVEDFRNAP